MKTQALNLISQKFNKNKEEYKILKDAFLQLGLIDKTDVELLERGNSKVDFSIEECQNINWY